jgi:hypothetical protein
METKKQKVFVSMNDKFLSGWGPAKNKINKFVIECENWEEAERVERNARKMREMKFVNVSRHFPAIKSNHYLSTMKYEDLGEIWKK